MTPARSSYVTSMMEVFGRSRRKTRGLYNRSQEHGNPTQVGEDLGLQYPQRLEVKAIFPDL